MSGNSIFLSRDLEQAFNSIGSSMMSLEFASKLMAFIYVYGGENSIFTQHEALLAGAGIAQQKLHIMGGEVPDPEGVILIQKYIKELEEHKDSTDWLHEICDRYELTVKDDLVWEKQTKKSR